MNRLSIIHILTVLKILLWVFFVPAFLFYILLVVPEYLACRSVKTDADIGITIWGYAAGCHGEEGAFTEAFFQLGSTELTIGVILIFITTFLIRKLKKPQARH